MKKETYGVDPNSKVTPLMVRDAIVQCFWEAHCMDTGIGEDDKEGKDANRAYCKMTVEKAFKDSGGDFDKPTKKSIINTMNSLAAFSKSFRDPSVIQEHFNEIMILVSKL
jgi:hypothetical protein